MGYNLNLACTTCKERAFVYRSHESESIREFGSLHWKRDCRKVCAIDNGYEEPDWVYDEGWKEICLPASMADEQREYIEARIEQTQQEIKDFVGGAR